MYCIPCEKELWEGWMFDSNAHEVTIMDNGFPYHDICNGPFAFCPPPPIDEAYLDWLMNNEPDEEWMELVNSNPELM